MYGYWQDPEKSIEFVDTANPNTRFKRTYVPFSYQRSGQNSKELREASQAPRPEDPWVLRTFRDPQGRFVDIVVRYRRNGTPVFKKKPVYVTRLVQVRSKVKSCRGLDIHPNPLSYSLQQLNIANESIGYKGGYSTGTVSGPIGLETFRIGWGGETPVPQPMFGSSLDWFLSHLKPPQSVIDEADSKAKQKLYADAQDMKANIAVMLVEARQTAESLVGAAKTLVETINAVKSGKFLKFLKGGVTKKKLSGRWLEAVYGFAPLISDIKGCIEAIREGRKPIVQDVNGRGKATYSEKFVQADNDTIRQSLTVECTVKVRYKVRIHVINEGSKLANETGLDTPSVAFWEKIPWSFVVDWFLPLGNYLETRDAFTGTRTMFVTRTVSYETSLRMERTFKKSATWQETKTVVTEAREFNVERKIISSVPALDLPSFKNPCSGMHAANALALLIQKFSKH